MDRCGSSQAAISEDEALRARQFFKWVKEEWDTPHYNIFIWDFHELQTEGGLYFIEEYARSPYDSHPNKEFAARACMLLFTRVIDVIENNGTGTLNTGESKQY